MVSDKEWEKVVVDCGNNNEVISTYLNNFIVFYCSLHIYDDDDHHYYPPGAHCLSWARLSC